MLISELQFFLINIWKQNQECLERNCHVEQQLKESPWYIMSWGAFSMTLAGDQSDI